MKRYADLLIGGADTRSEMGGEEKQARYDRRSSVTLRSGQKQGFGLAERVWVAAVTLSSGETAISKALNWLRLN